MSIPASLAGGEAAAHTRGGLARDLRRLLAGDVEFDPHSRLLYATDAGLNQIEPLGIVAPRDEEDVVRLVKYAAAHGVPLVPRGSGSGLAGGAIGPGLQVDFTRYMNRLLEMAPDGSWARTQPGLTLGELNQHAKGCGTFFAPDPSSENYCSLGGMCGTNSSGAHSVAYGATKDHVLALRVVMADGTTLAVQPLPAEGPDLSLLVNSHGLPGRALGTVLPLLQSNRDEILAAQPRVVKNCCGYRLETVFANDGLVHLPQLFVGAEGTLGLVTELTLNLVPLPAVREIAMLYFPSVFACGEALAGILALSPSAVEIMDSRFLSLVRRRYPHINAMLPSRADTALLIELEADSEDEVQARFAELRHFLATTAAIQMVRPTSPEETARLWHMRKSAVALIHRTPGPRRPLPFIEDVTVHPTEVPKYIDFLQHVLDRYGVEAVMFGHLGDGNIHTRPLLDPKDSGDLRIMESIYQEVSDYVLSVHGTLSGEHGDGLARTPYIRRMYGSRIYSLFEQVKAAFDPQTILNPGKKVAPQADRVQLSSSLRFGPHYRSLPQHPFLHFPAQEYEREIEKCHGCGQCKSTVATTMCPVYKATRREHASPRAKANLLRGIITGTLDPHHDPQAVYGLPATKAITDYCIGCGMCAVECPSAVNIPKLMLEAKSQYRRQHVPRPAEIILARAEIVSSLGQRLAPLSNRLANQPVVRTAAQPLLGIDRRRKVPAFAPRSLEQIIAAAGPSPPTDPSQPPISEVAYFYDLFANYNAPEIALAAERVLRAHGLQVVYPHQRGSGVPEMLNGFVESARDTAEFNVRAFLPFARAGAALVSAEPTASYAFKVHYPGYVNSHACSIVAAAFQDLGEFLVNFRAEHPDLAPAAAPLSRQLSVSAASRERPLRVAYHLPCHLKAQQVGSPALTLLHEIPNLELVNLDAGCCGMAGTFGMKAHTYDLSLQIGKPLLDRVAEAAPDVLVSECSTCRLQLLQATGLPTIHPVVLLADTYQA